MEYSEVAVHVGGGRVQTVQAAGSQVKEQRLPRFVHSN